MYERDFEYVVYEVFPDGKKFERFRHSDAFTCEAEADHLKYNCRNREVRFEIEKDYYYQFHGIATMI